MNFFTEVIIHLSDKVLSHLGQVIIDSLIKLKATGLVFRYLKDVSLLIQPLIQEALGAETLCVAKNKTVRPLAFDFVHRKVLARNYIIEQYC